MIELDVAPRRTKIVAPADEPARYLVLGDFGATSMSRALEPLTVDRDNLDAVMSILHVEAGGMRLRDLEDFHPDRLYQRFDLAAPEMSSPAAPEPEPASPQADIATLLRPTSLLEQITGGGDPFEQYVKELGRAHAAPQKKSVDPSAALSERMNSMLHHPRFQTLESAWRGLDF